MAEAPLDDLMGFKQKIAKLFEASIETIAPDERDMAPPIFLKHEAGDLQWYLWPRLKDNGTEFEDPEYVRQATKQNVPITHIIESFDVPSRLVERRYSFRENFEAPSILRVTPAFINVTLSKEWMAKRIQNMLIDGIDTWAPKLPIKRAIVDFSSHNMVEMHMDQLRCTIIGDTLARMLEFSKVDVLRRNHVRDLSSQFGVLIEYLFERPHREVSDRDFIRFEVLLMASESKLKKRAQEALISLQGGDERYLKAWTRLCEIRRKCFELLHERLDVHLEEKGESFYNHLGQTLDMLNEKGLIVEHEGAKVTKPIPGRKPLIVVDSDGGFEYALTDLALLWYRINVENAELIMYVSHQDQKEHFDMIFTTARLAGWLPTSRSEYPKTSHAGFNRVTCEVGVSMMSKLADFLDEAEIQCKAAHRKRGRIGEDLEHTAKAVAYAAVKYAHLSNRPAKIDFDQMLDVEGDTVVYLFYAHTRATSALQTSRKDIEELKKKGELKLESDLERELGLHLLRFSELIEDAFTKPRPNAMCEYLYALAKKFHHFHDKHQVVGSAEETSRLLLCEATRVVMSKCFDLLGITPV